jgi:hypothetical protein
MLKLKSFEDISGFDGGWLKAKHHFALGPYGNPAHEAVGNLIVLNDDEIAPHTGFDLHHHENVEIVSYPACDNFRGPRGCRNAPLSILILSSGACRLLRHLELLILQMSQEHAIC